MRPTDLLLNQLFEQRHALHVVGVLGHVVVGEEHQAVVLDAPAHRRVDHSIEQHGEGVDVESAVLRVLGREGLDVLYLRADRLYGDGQRVQLNLKAVGEGGRSREGGGGRGREEEGERGRESR